MNDGHLAALSGVEADYGGKAEAGITPEEAAERLRVAALALASCG